MKFLLPLLFIIIFNIFNISCDDDYDRELNKINNEKSEALKQKERLEKRFQRLRKERRAKTETLLKKQIKERKFQADTTQLEFTKESKIAYYLDKAKAAEKIEEEEYAIQFANKVLELDPKNPEALSILKRQKKIKAKIKSIERKLIRENDPKRREKELKKDLRELKQQGVKF